jgi:dCTP deaminase
LILSHADLVRAWRTRRITFDPDITLDQITLSSIDLHLGCEFAKLLPKPGLTINPSLDDFDPAGLYTHEDLCQPDSLGRPQLFKLDPGEFVVAFTYEKIRLSTSLVASIEGRTRLARYGLAVHTTAPHIHPAFDGPIALELHNIGPIPIQLRPRLDKICQLIIHELKSPVPLKLANAISSFMHQKTIYKQAR